MRTNNRTLSPGWVILLALIIQLPSASAQGTAFSYQGRLDESAGPANGTYDLTFRLYDAVSGGSSQGGPLTNSAVSVSDGYFTVTLDFGLNPFGSGAARWVEIAVRTNGGGAFGLLTPRQALTPAPYAIYSGNVSGAGISGTINSSSIATGSIGANQLANASVTSAKLADGATLAELLDDDGVGSGLDADLLDGLQASAFWQLGGNAGTTPGTHFLGTTDNQPVEFKVNNQRALRLEFNTNGAPNVIGGSLVNFVAAGVTGATIGGGGAQYFFGSGYTNQVRADFGTVGGGGGNVSSASFATVGGGMNNYSSGSRATVSGGRDNVSSGSLATVSGGSDNVSSGGSATVGGGLANTGAGLLATVPGGYFNSASGDYSFAAGTFAKANHSGTFVWADALFGEFTSTGTNQFLIRASGGVGIGTASPQGQLQVNGGTVLHSSASGTVTPDSASSSNLLNIMVGGGSNPVATNGALNGISFYEAAGAAAVLSLGYDGSGLSASNALRIYNSAASPLFTFEASGELGIGTTSPQERLHVVGNILATGTITPSSDRNLKKNFADVDSRAVLESVALLPIQQWTYQAEADSIRHVGPMAQDFRAAFGLGANDTTIATVDADGVALAAIQGLNGKVEAKTQKSEVRIQKLEAENIELRARLEKLESLLARQKLGLP